MIPAAFAWAIICATVTALIGRYAPISSNVILPPIISLSTGPYFTSFEHLLRPKLQLEPPTRTIHVATAVLWPEPTPVSVSSQPVLKSVRTSHGIGSPLRLGLTHGILVAVLVLILPAITCAHVFERHAVHHEDEPSSRQHDALDDSDRKSLATQKSTEMPDGLESPRASTLRWSTIASACLVIPPVLVGVLVGFVLGLPFLKSTRQTGIAPPPTLWSLFRAWMSVATHLLAYALGFFVGEWAAMLAWYLLLAFVLQRCLDVKSIRVPRTPQLTSNPHSPGNTTRRSIMHSALLVITAPLLLPSDIHASRLNPSRIREWLSLRIEVPTGLARALRRPRFLLPAPSSGDVCHTQTRDWPTVFSLGTFTMTPVPPARQDPACPSPPSPREGSVACTASETPTVKHGGGGGEPESPVSLVASRSLRDENVHSPFRRLLRRKLGSQATEPVSRGPWPLPSAEGGGVPTVKKPAPTSPEAIAAWVARPPAPQKAESRTRTESPLFDVSANTVDGGEKKRTKAQSRRYRERALAVAIATGARAAPTPVEGEEKVWTKSRARRERGKRLAIFYAIGA